MSTSLSCDWERRRRNQYESINIVIWNLESGYIKAVLRDPKLTTKSLEERAVEKVIIFLHEMLFVKNTEKSAGVQYTLVTCHADGYIRLWDINDNRMVGEVFFVLMVV